MLFWSIVLSLPGGKLCRINCDNILVLFSIYFCKKLVIKQVKVLQRLRLLEIFHISMIVCGWGPLVLSWGHLFFFKSLLCKLFNSVYVSFKYCDFIKFPLSCPMSDSTYFTLHCHRSHSIYWSAFHNLELDIFSKMALINYIHYS